MQSRIQEGAGIIRIPDVSSGAGMKAL